MLGQGRSATLVDREICVIQFSTGEANYVIDALAVRDFDPIAGVLESKDVAEDKKH